MAAYSITDVEVLDAMHSRVTARWPDLPSRDTAAGSWSVAPSLSSRRTNGLRDSG